MDAGAGRPRDARLRADLDAGLVAPKTHVTLPSKTARARPGIEVHRSATLTEADIARVDGIPCTGLARTLVCREAALPEPEGNVWITLDDGAAYKADFLLRAGRLFLETNA